MPFRRVPDVVRTRQVPYTGYSGRIQRPGGIKNGGDPLSARLSFSNRGASLVEYVLLVSLIAIAAVLALQFFGESVEGSLDRSGSLITSATN